MILSIGEILYDIFPTYRRMGGAPFNFAFHLRALGFPVILISRVGTDENGRRILSFLEEKGFDTSFIQKDSQKQTGQVLVETDEQGSPHFHILRDAAYDEMEFRDEIAAQLHKIPKLIYCGTLIQRTPKGAETLMKILENRDPDTFCFYDMNLRPECYDHNSIIKSLIHCDVLKVSDAELSLLKSLFGADTSDRLFIEDLMHNYFIRWLCLTRGAEGSSLFTPDGVWSEPAGKEIPVADTVGAGDAYSAMLAMGFLKGWKPEIIVKRATAFAGAVCGIPGAIPEDAGFYEHYSEWTKENSQ
ncbi:MAG: carbohydrate kinase [Desulfobacterales bacterium]